ncbi:UNVERIFIED_CONTAM: hypothetical protein PYX00_002476 [Menopon gallinae]|uniref:Major facilitator superfamily (MFS) profile domain-containing protein n=1 Tax=Menopon gallinae TaxID=328185 RepID=A0AAW2IH88_9NEOP
MTCCGKKKFTRQQLFTLSAIGSVHFALSICVSLQAPFYPKEAERKNASSTEYGFVFGIYELVSFVSSPILGHYIDVIGAKTLLSSGIVIAAISSVAFGMLELINDHLTFIVLSFVVRGIEALGSSAAVTSAFAITASVFPENVATTFATLEIFYGVGYIAGPTIGGALYSHGGFILPFTVMGCILLVDGLFVFFALPPLQKGISQPKAKVTELFKVPIVFMDSMAIMATSICMGFYSATLERHIREYELSEVTVGLIFVISGGVYACTAPIIGRICDKKVNPKIMILIGNCVVITSVLLVGPARFTSLTKSLEIVIAGLVLEGLGMAFILVSSFVDAIRSAVAGGFPDGIATYGLISGLWAASFSLGDFIGPSVGGVLTQKVGFPDGSLFIAGVHIVVFVLMSVFVFRSGNRKRKVGNMELNLSTIQTSMEKDQNLNPVSVISETDQIKKISESYGSVANGKYIQK